MKRDPSACSLEFHLARPPETAKLPPPMAYELTPDPTAPDPVESGSSEEKDFQVSSEPVVPEGSRHAQERQTHEGSKSGNLWLLVRDPRSLFAYWDIDWPSAFGEENPKAREVRLRILDADGRETTSLAVEPRAGNCQVEVDDAAIEYHGELGFLDGAGEWQLVSRSRPLLPPEQAGASKGEGNFATIPLHLSFQRMIDATQSASKTPRALTETIADLRERAAADVLGQDLNAQEREIVHALEEAAASEPPRAEASSATPDLWAQHSLETILGFGNSSLGAGFGGSSRG